MALLFAAEAVRAQVDAVTALLNGGYLELYDGKRPVGPAATVTSQKRLATLRFKDPAFKVEAGRAVAVPEPDTDAANSGKATWFRCYTATRVAVLDGSVGRQAHPGVAPADEADLLMNATDIQKHAEVSVDGFVLATRD